MDSKKKEGNGRKFRNLLTALKSHIALLDNHLKKDECADKPCMNGATCIDLYNKFMCICPPHFEVLYNEYLSIALFFSKINCYFPLKKILPPRDIKKFYVKSSADFLNLRFKKILNLYAYCSIRFRVKHAKTV